MESPEHKEMALEWGVASKGERKIGNGKKGEGHGYTSDIDKGSEINSRGSRGGQPAAYWGKGSPMHYLCIIWYKIFWVYSKRSAMSGWGMRPISRAKVFDWPFWSV